MPKAKKPIGQYGHKDKQRVNDPPAGLATRATDPDAGAKTCAYDAHLGLPLHFDAQSIRDDLTAVIEQGLAGRTLDEAKAAFQTLNKTQGPYQNWAGRVEHTCCDLPTVSLHIHEPIDPRTSIETVCRRNGDGYEQLSLFGVPVGSPPQRGNLCARHRPQSGG